MWETLGPIADRSLERLGTSDLAIVQFRRIMVDAARSFVESGTVIGRTEPHIPHAKLMSFEGIVPKSTDWRTIGTSQDEIVPQSGQKVA